MMARRPALLGIAGSLRRASWSSDLLRGVAADVADRADLTLFPVAEVPLYNQDEDEDEAAVPAGVARLRAAIKAADGIVIASPEYNHGISGVLKNLLDWASRPYGRATLTGKPVLTITSSPSPVGGARAHAQIDQTLSSIGARVLLRPQAVVGDVFAKVANGRIVHAPTAAFLAAGIDDLLHDIGIRPIAIEQD